MRRNPAADVDANRGEFRPIDPNAFVAWLRVARCLHTQSAQSINEELLDCPKIGPDIAPPFSQIQDRVAHNLSWPVIGGASAAVGFNKLDAGTLQDMGAGQNLLLFGITAHCHDVRVLHEEQVVETLTALAFFDDLLLDAKRFVPTEASEIQYFAFPHRVRSLRMH